MSLGLVALYRYMSYSLVNVHAHDFAISAHLASVSCLDYVAYMYKSMNFFYLSVSLTYLHMSALDMPAAKPGVCSKCGTFESSGKRSCCARGGAWYLKCGSAGELGFEHTWTEGLQACTGFVGASSGQAAAHDTLRHETVLGEVRNTTTQQLNVSKPRNTTYSAGGASHVYTTQSNGSRKQIVAKQNNTTYSTGCGSNANTTQANVSQQYTTTYSTRHETIMAIADSTEYMKLTKFFVFFNLLFGVVHLKM